MSHVYKLTVGCVKFLYIIVINKMSSCIHALTGGSRSFVFWNALFGVQPYYKKVYIAIYMIVCIHVVTTQTSVLHVNLQVWCMTCVMVAVVVIRDWLCQVPNESIIIVINKMSSCIYMHLQVVVGPGMPSLWYSPITKYGST